MSSKVYHIKLNGKVYEVEIEEVKEGKEGKEVEVQKTEVKENVKPVGIKKASELTSGEEITAPMPGNIFNILVKKGQTVKKGDVVAILEAMKMENEIIAPVDGTISSINVDKGQNVNLGDIIVKIA